MRVQGFDMPFARVVRFSVIMILAIAATMAFSATDQVTVESGKLQGTTNADGSVRMFKGVPFAAPPVGDLRWKAPQSAPKWTSARAADKFGSACLQTNVFGDIYFRDAQPSEDCLNLDIWIPTKAASSKLPVLVWFYGGGFVAGSASEPRYDGENLAKKGIIVVNPNYRLGAFGFFAHPELIKESPHKASGNYGLLDQVAALQWVVENISAFGGMRTLPSRQSKFRPSRMERFPTSGGAGTTLVFHFFESQPSNVRSVRLGAFCKYIGALC
jgi:para-nitrobenzyl esterase